MHVPTFTFGKWMNIIEWQLLRLIWGHKKDKNTQAVHILLQLNSDIAGFNTLYYKYLMYKHNVLDLLTSTNH